MGVLDKEPFRPPAQMGAACFLYPSPKSCRTSLKRVLPRPWVVSSAKSVQASQMEALGRPGFGPYPATSRLVTSFCSSLVFPVWNLAF